MQADLVAARLCRASVVRAGLPPPITKAVRKSSAYSQKFSAKEWKAEGPSFRLPPQILLPRHIR